MNTEKYAHMTLEELEAELLRLDEVMVQAMLLKQYVQKKFFEAVCVNAGERGWGGHKAVDPSEQWDKMPNAKSH